MEVYFRINEPQYNICSLFNFSRRTHLCVQTWELSVVEVISSPLPWLFCIIHKTGTCSNWNAGENASLDWDTAWKKRWVLHWTANTAALELALQPSCPALTHSCRMAGPLLSESHSLGSACRAVSVSRATAGLWQRGSPLSSRGSNSFKDSNIYEVGVSLGRQHWARVFLDLWLFPASSLCLFPVSQATAHASFQWSTGRSPPWQATQDISQPVHLSITWN